MNKKYLLITGIVVICALFAVLLFVANSNKPPLGKEGEMTNSGKDLPKSPDSDSAQAKATLVKFFDFLSSGNYVEASKLYGGDYSVMQDYFPSCNISDSVCLWQNNCGLLQCLKVMNAVQKPQTIPFEFAFDTSFVGEDGQKFVRGPCCGATEEEMPSQSEFEFIVRKTPDGFKVITSPVYVP